MKKLIKKFVSIALALTFVLMSVPSINLNVNATCSLTQDEAIAWVASKVGESLDYDGVYGAQCPDLIKYYYQALGVAPVKGNAIEYTTNALPSGWKRIPDAVPQKGDILIYTGPSIYGHVAIFESTNVTYHQNYNKPSVEKITNKAYDAICGGTYWGVIRPDFINVKITNITITNKNSSGYTVTCTVSSNVGISSVKFPTWTSSNGQDDIIWGEGTKTGTNTYSYNVKVSDHKNETGTYNTHIYVYDNNGKILTNSGTSTCIGGNGDINGDNKVDILDVTLLRAYITGNTTLTSSQIKRADINGDGKADIADLTLLREMIV